MVSLGTLVSGFAHEVNNPNNYIRLNIQGLADFHREIDGILERLHDQDPDLTLMRLPYPRAREIIDGMTEGVLEGSYRIERLIDDLKAFARDQKGDLDQAVDLNEVVESAVKLVNSVIRKTTSHFDCTLSDLPITVRGDGHQIEQVVINLLTNACQALEDRRKAIRISVGANHDGRTAFVEVEDEGVGISEEDIPHIADPFYSTKRKSGGTGLGLSVSYQIIQDHRGELLFDSEVGRGTVATILLPL